MNRYDARQQFIEGLERYVSGIESDQGLSRLPYTYAKHFLPHDVEAREITHARTRREVLEGLGIQPVYPGTPRNPSERINAVRMFLPLCVFDAKRCEKGLQALRHYRVDYDEKNKTPRKTPKHDFASHPSDAFGELAMQSGSATPRPRQAFVDSAYDDVLNPPRNDHEWRQGGNPNPIPNMGWKPIDRPELVSEDYDILDTGNEEDFR